MIALAERLGTDLVITLGHRRFAAVRPRHVPAFHLFSRRQVSIFSSTHVGVAFGL